MVWHKAAWIPPFFAALDQRFPARYRGTDGTIGDPAHQGSTSGHNPDDTAGSKPERTDADTKPEVRAADASSVLRDPGGVTMRDVIEAILLTPADRNRLIYIIFDGWIWRAAGGWRREDYGGGDKHRTHIHLSGHPDADDNAAPWTSILTVGMEGVDMAQPSTSEVVRLLTQGSDDRGFITPESAGMDPAAESVAPAGQYNLKSLDAKVTSLGAGLKELAQAVAELRDLVGAGGTDPQVIEDAAFRGAQRAERE